MGALRRVDSGTTPFQRASLVQKTKGVKGPSKPPYTFEILSPALRRRSIQASYWLELFTELFIGLGHCAA